MRKTKIICTLGPATDNTTIIRELLVQGMNVARLNFSHGSHEEHLNRLEVVKKLRKEMNLPVALLMDTQGPKIRLGKFENNNCVLVPGKIFTLTTDEISGNNQIASVSYKNLPRDLNIGDRILIADGLLELRVQSKTDSEIQCMVVIGGPISNNKGVNVPGVTITMPYISEHDKKDLLFAIAHNFEFVASSFTRSADDVNETRQFLKINGGEGIKIISKIENRDGVNNIDDIIIASDGIMIARGDMGVEIPFEELPFIQKDIIRRCKKAGKPVITATQMLESMINNPGPTRAEITDVANAIYDGTSATMLSGETSIGRYPIESVKTMSVIIIETEKNINYIEELERIDITKSNSVTNAIGRATCTTALTLDAAAIVTVTQSGHTAQMISKYRPDSPIIATTTSEKVKNQLSLVWGVQPLLIEKKNSTDEIFDQAIIEALKNRMIKEGDLVVITGGLLANISGTTNTIRVQIIGNILAKGIGCNEFNATGILRVIDDTGSTTDFHAGDIAVISHASDEILPILKHAGGIITEDTALDSHIAAEASALKIPVIINAANATKILKSGVVATIKSKDGIVYLGDGQPNE